MAGDFSFHACGYMSDTVMIYILFKGKYLGSIRHPNSDDAKVSPLNSFTYSGVQYQAFKIYSSSAARVVLLGQTKDRGYLSYIYGKCEKEVNSYVDSCDSTRFFD